MNIKNISGPDELYKVTASNWNEIIWLLCKYGYTFVSKEVLVVAPVSFFQRLWEFILNSFGKDSRRQQLAKEWLIQKEVLLQKRLIETHSCLSYIITSAQEGLAKGDFWKLNVDYTGMGTAFFKTDIEIKRTRSIPEQFSVLIDPPRS